MLADTVPKGFRRATGSGLIVPEDISREREVWTHDEGRLLDRATKLANKRGLKLLLACPDDTCKAAPIERIRLKNGDWVLRCAHKDRVFVKAF